VPGALTGRAVARRDQRPDSSRPVSRCRLRSRRGAPPCPGPMPWVSITGWLEVVGLEVVPAGNDEIPCIATFPDDRTWVVESVTSGSGTARLSRRLVQTGF